MVNLKLLDYVKKQLAQGLAREQIQGALLAQGWQAVEIGEALNLSVSPGQPVAPSNPGLPVYSSPTSATARRPSKIIPIVIAIIGGLLIVGGGVFAYINYFPTPEKIVKKSITNLLAVKSLEFSGEMNAEVNISESSDGLDDNPFFSMQPQDINISYKYSGALDIKDKSNPKASLVFNIKTNAVPLVEMSAVAELRVIDKAVYIKLGDLPNLGLIDLSVLSNQWIKIDSAALKNQAGLKQYEEQIKKAQAKQKLTPEQIKKIKTALEQAKIIKITKKLANEKIAGVDTYHYKYAINKEELKKFYLNVAEIAMQTVPAETQAGFDEIFSSIGSMTGEIWIGKKDYLPYKSTSESTIVKTDKSEATGKITSSLLLKNFNKPVQVAVPEPVKTLEEVLTGLFKGFNLFGSSGALPSTNTMGFLGNTLPSIEQLGLSQGGNADPDQDGLSDQEEFIYGTDPDKPDTDGDGFKDGDEVKNGYNPNGAGKLEKIIPKEGATGLDYTNAIVVMENTESAGVEWEYDWLKNNACKNNGKYNSLAEQALVEYNKHFYDELTAKCNDGTAIDYYFIIDNFYNKTIL